MTITQRLDRLIADLKDTNLAILRAKAGHVVEQCGCGAITVKSPCPKCRREKGKT
jgi:hypothetical protein